MKILRFRIENIEKNFVEIFGYVFFMAVIAKLGVLVCGDKKKVGLELCQIMLRHCYFSFADIFRYE